MYLHSSSLFLYQMSVMIDFVDEKSEQIIVREKGAKLRVNPTTLVRSPWFTDIGCDRARISNRYPL